MRQAGQKWHQRVLYSPLVASLLSRARVVRSCNRVVQGMRKERSSARVLYFVYLYFFKGCLHLVETCVFLATCPLKDFFMWWVHTLENPFYRILRFKGGWAGQCSHRLEVFEMGSHFEF